MKEVSWVNKQRVISDQKEGHKAAMGILHLGQTVASARWISRLSHLQSSHEEELDTNMGTHGAPFVHSVLHIF